MRGVLSKLLCRFKGVISTQGHVLCCFCMVFLSEGGKQKCTSCCLFSVSAAARLLSRLLILSAITLRSRSFLRIVSSCSMRAVWALARRLSIPLLSVNHTYIPKLQTSCITLTKTTFNDWSNGHFTCALYIVYPGMCDHAYEKLG